MNKHTSQQVSIGAVRCDDFVDISIMFGRIRSRIRIRIRIGNGAPCIISIFGQLDKSMTHKRMEIQSEYMVVSVSANVEATRWNCLMLDAVITDGKYGSF